MARWRHYSQFFVILCKLAAAYVILHVFRRGLLRENLWLFQEKHTEARDNGYHLYRYVKQFQPEIHAYYSIVRGSPDESKLQSFGGLIPAETLKHYIYWLAAKYSVNSQPHGAAPAPTYILYRFRRFCRKDQKVVFLQHGITKDELSHELMDYSNTRFSLFSCAALPECAFVRQVFGYPPQVAQLLGFCRFDQLMRAGQPLKQILIMPTFRLWLIAEHLEQDATEAETARFEKSDFFLNFKRLLTDERLLNAARARGYSIVFYPHYSLQSYIKSFLPFRNETVVIADRQHYDVQRLMMESAAMVTDYSSVFFDFAYMKKPEIFLQFDEAQYRQGHYKPGYFDYRRDGFGPVYTEAGETVDELIRLIQSDCRMEDKYLQRVTAFFAFTDEKNCERTFHAIQQLM